MNARLEVSQTTKQKMKNILKVSLLLAALAVIGTVTMRADEVTQWNRNMLVAAQTANANPLLQARVGALVHSAVFDAVNGIERRFTPAHVEPSALPGASRR